MRQTIIAAMSGGVDSSVAAALYHRQGYEVIGVTLRLKHPDPAFSEAQSCASKMDNAAVENVCSQLGIEHVYLDEYPSFAQEVLHPAFREYAAGRTPNPCTWCNPLIKFGKLIAYARMRGAEKVITGHYARLERNSLTRLRRGSDPAKDQTYFLYRLTQEQLQKIEFPIGELEKSTVRDLARSLGLVNAEKKDSQDACFQVPGECFSETLRRLFAESSLPGRFLYRGKTVGRHNGVHQFTIGQRKGLGVALGVPAYVAAIDAVRGDVILTTEEQDLATREFLVDQLNFQTPLTMAERPMQTQVRYRGKAVPALVKPLSETSCHVLFDEPQRAVTPGQAAVFYDEDFLLGGGVIAALLS